MCWKQEPTNLWPKSKNFLEGKLTSQDKCRQQTSNFTSTLEQKTLKWTPWSCENKRHKTSSGLKIWKARRNNSKTTPYFIAERCLLGTIYWTLFQELREEAFETTSPAKCKGSTEAGTTKLGASDLYFSVLVVAVTKQMAGWSFRCVYH